MKVISCVLVVCLASLGAVTVATAQEAPYVSGQVLVKFTPGAARSAIAEQHRARPKEALLAERVWVLEVEPGEELEVAANLRRNPNVEFAEPNYIYTVIPCETGDCTAPNDPLFGGKWDLHNRGYITNVAGDVVVETGMAGADISWLEAREYLDLHGGATTPTVIGIIDTGIRATHQDLAGKVVAGRNFCPSFLCLIGTVNANNWADDNGHGTHVAGIAAAHGNNGVGVPGVAYMSNVRFLAVKVCGGPLGVCNAAGITNGIIWAVNNGAHVLNLSLGGGAPSTATQNALQYALDNNVLPVCASGNDGAGTVSYPAAFPQCMAVGSTSWSDTRASYSNYGPEVEVVAPGGDLGTAPHSYILAPYYSNDTSYAYLAGTSMATPQVAGLAGLLRATGLTSAAAIRARLRATADDLGPAGFDNEYGHGRINAYRAVTGMDPFIAMQLTARPSINLRANGHLQVVLYGREAQTFSLTQVLVDSISLGGTPLARRTNGTPFATWSDVDGDGRLDLVLHFSVPALVAAGDLSAGTDHVTLYATLTDGRGLRAFMHVTVH
jgi:thermitase